MMAGGGEGCHIHGGEGARGIRRMVGRRDGVLQRWRDTVGNEWVSEKLRSRSEEGGSGCTNMARGGCQKYYDEGVGVRKMTMRELVS